MLRVFSLFVAEPNCTGRHSGTVTPVTIDSVLTVASVALGSAATPISYPA